MNKSVRAAQAASTELTLDTGERITIDRPESRVFHFPDGQAFEVNLGQLAPADTGTAEIDWNRAAQWAFAMWNAAKGLAGQVLGGTGSASGTAALPDCHGTTTGTADMTHGTATISISMTCGYPTAQWLAGNRQPRSDVDFGIHIDP
jgi:hypothetical protein